MAMNPASRAVSFAATQPDLQARMPPQLRQTSLTQKAFNQVSGVPNTTTKQEAEISHQETQGRASTMVTRQQAKPVLRPCDHRAIDRVLFDREWLKEQRAARMALYQEQIESLAIDNYSSQEQSFTHAAPTR